MESNIKISALNPASPLTGREMIPAVQDGFPVKVYVSTLLNSVSLLAESLSNLIKPIAENGFNVTDENGNIGMKYDGNGLDASLLSSHFQDLINGLINLAISTAKGSSIAPLVNSLIPAIYLPSFVDDVIDIDIFGKENIDKYCADNNGNTNILTDKFCYDDIQKIFVVAKQVNNAIELTTSGSPEFGKVYINILSNKTYRWSGTIMVAIGSDLALGETSATAYAGDKGNKNANDIISVKSLINNISLILASISNLITQIDENGFNVVDANGYAIFNVDENGLDAALLSVHIISLIKNIEGLGLALGETSATAYAGDKGKKDANDIKSLQAAMAGVQSIAEIDEDGFVVCDQNGYTIFRVDENGYDFANISSHAISVLKNAGIGALNYEIIETIN